jgi:glycosyltransferase involved in cell wall biosynthesis
MKIRVLHVIDHLGFGGATIAVKNIVENLTDPQIDSFICALRQNPVPVNIRANVISLKCHKYSPRSIPAIARLSKQYRIDIIHAHLEKSIISSLFASFLCNSKLVIHEHGAILRGRKGCIYRFLLRLLHSRAAVVIANSQATKSALNQTAGFAKQSIWTIDNFVDPARFDYRAYDRKKTRAGLGITEDTIVVGFVGRLDYCKGADLMLDAAAALCKSDEQFCFLIVGDGPERKKLEESSLRLGLEHKVIFAGLSENPAEVICGFDIAVVPSRREAFGIAAVEFMRMRIPVVASAVGGLAELVQHEETGILLDSLNENSIAEAIKRLAENPALRRSLSDNAEVFSRKFEGKQQLKQIKDLYRKLCL